MGAYIPVRYRLNDIESVSPGAESLGITLDWDVGWMPVRVQPYVHGFTGATLPRSLLHGIWMDDSAPERPVP